MFSFVSLLQGWRVCESLSCHSTTDLVFPVVLDVLLILLLIARFSPDPNKFPFATNDMGLPFYRSPSQRAQEWDLTKLDPKTRATPAITLEDPSI